MIQTELYCKVGCDAPDGCASEGPLFRLAYAARQWALNAGWHEFGDGTWLCRDCHQDHGAPEPTHVIGP